MSDFKFSTGFTFPTDFERIYLSFPPLRLPLPFPSQPPTPFQVAAAGTFRELGALQADGEAGADAADLLRAMAEGLAHALVSDFTFAAPPAPPPPLLFSLPPQISQTLHLIQPQKT